MVEADVRQRIRTETDRSFVVRAGAGAGKTTLLVERLVAVAAEVGWSRVAAVTFSEAAAAELVHRLRGKVGTAEGLDEAAVETLHAFAIRLLRRWGMAAGLPPAFRVTTGDAATERADRVWDEITARHHADPAARHEWEAALDAGLSMADAREYWRGLGEHWDRLDPVRVAEGGVALVLARAASDLRAVAAEVGPDAAARLTNMADALEGRPCDPFGGRKLCDWQWALLGVASRGGEGAFPTAPRMQKEMEADWGATDASTMRAATKVLHDELKNLPRVRAYVAARPLLFRLAEEARDEARARLQEGEPNFHDVLVAARDLLFDPAVAREVAEAYPRVLIDEAQDVDPLQLEIAARLAEAVDRRGGSLFFVGDPQQSIYGFRRADPTVLDRALGVLGPDAELLSLGSNYRSLAPVLGWINDHMGALMPEATQGRPFQALALGRSAEGGGVRPVLVPVPKANGSENHRSLAESTAGAIVAVHGEGRPLKEIAVLLPTRTGLPALSRELDRLNVPYRLEAASLLLATTEAREFRALARALDDPSNELAVVAALRSGPLAVSDKELLAYVRRTDDRPFDRWNFERHEEPIFGPMRAWRRTMLDAYREGLGPAMAALADVARLREVARLGRRSRDAWRRIDLVIELARAEDASGGRSLRRLLEGLDAREDDAARDEIFAADEADDDAVRVLTIHASKGRQFPVVVLAGLGNLQAPADSARIRFDEDGVITPTWSGLAAPGGDAVKARAAEAFAAERARLLYVALTRAEDLLVPILPVFAPPEKSTAKLQPWHHLATRLTEGWTPPDPEPLADPEPTPVPEIEPWAERQARAQKGAALRTITATRLVRERRAALATTDDDTASPADAEFATRTGAGGTSLGRAVHGVLQNVAWDDESSVGPAAARAAAAEGIADADEVARLAEAGRAWAAATLTGTVLREVFLSAPLGDVLLEGYADVTHRLPDGGLHLIDWKTDRKETRADVERAMESYRLQAGVYGLACEETLKQRPARMTFVFLRALAAGREWAVHDVPLDDDLLQEVRDLMA